MEIINTSGRRKTSVARVYLKAGNGNITVNNRDFKDYFSVPMLQGAQLTMERCKIFCRTPVTAIGGHRRSVRRC
jgi:ribosomal protein S9